MVHLDTVRTISSNRNLEKCREAEERVSRIGKVGEIIIKEFRSRTVKTKYHHIMLDHDMRSDRVPTYQKRFRDKTGSNGI